MKIKSFIGIGTRRRQEDSYAIVEVQYKEKDSTIIADSNNNPSFPESPELTTDSNPTDSHPTEPYSSIEQEIQNSAPYIDSSQKSRTLIVVADGMGGHDCGDEASQNVVQGMANYWEEYPDEPDSEEKIKKAVILTGVAYEQKTRGREMGSTMIMASIEGNKVYIAHCGDSRIYVWRKDNHQFFYTNDHIRFSEFGWELVANAFFTGHCFEIRPEIRQLELYPGDRLMLCTDGVFKFIPQEDLRRIFTGDNNLAEAAVSLEEYCQAMSRDNYTAVLVEF